MFARPCSFIVFHDVARLKIGWVRDRRSSQDAPEGSPSASSGDAEDNSDQMKRRLPSWTGLRSPATVRAEEDPFPAI
ncbi:hypothetical protein PsYK624_145510 [Phanerochaete sordida]|uniref:Uncharacterized protein n=1 Tax=Phanerochaete sordida TaxID=48140 RepID=A0A9P3LKA0_9APHY|nr:hypothetical protein PsYK624_145510 [Phanerochaete sordida]